MGMSKQTIIDELHNFDINDTRLKEIGLYLEKIPIPSTVSEDEIVMNELVKIVQQFTENKIYRKNSELIRGIGMLIIVKTGKNGYVRPVSACTFQQKEPGLYHGKQCYYINSVATMKTVKWDDKITIRDLIKSTFCTYLMAYTNQVLNHGFQASLTYLFNDGGVPGFMCYSLAAILTGNVVVTMDPEKGRNYSIGEIMTHIDNNTINKVAEIYKHVAEIEEVTTETGEENFELSMSWYLENARKRKRDASIAHTTTTVGSVRS